MIVVARPDPAVYLREFACLTSVILAPLRVEAGLHAHSATSLPEAPEAPVASYRSTFFIVLLAPRGPFFAPNRGFWLRIFLQTSPKNNPNGRRAFAEKEALCLQIPSSLRFSCGLRLRSMRFWLPNASLDFLKLRAF